MKCWEKAYMSKNGIIVMETHSKATHDEKSYDPLAIPKKNFTFILFSIFVLFIAVIFYVAFTLNRLLYGMCLLLSLTFFVRPKRVFKKEKTAWKIKEIFFWIGLSLVIWSTQMGLLVVTVQEIFRVTYNWIDWAILPIIIFPLITACIEFVIFSFMQFSYQNKLGTQYSGWNKGEKTKDQAEHIFNLKKGRIWKIAIAITILVITLTVFIYFILDLTGYLPFIRDTRFLYLIGGVEIGLMVIIVWGVKKRMISKQMTQVSQPEESIPSQN